MGVESGPGTDQIPVFTNENYTCKKQNGFRIWEHAQLVGRYPKSRVWSDRARSTSGPFHHAGHFTTRGMCIRLGLRELLPQQYEVTSYWAALLPRTSLACPGSAEAPRKGLNCPRTG